MIKYNDGTLEELIDEIEELIDVLAFATALRFSTGGFSGHTGPSGARWAH